MENLTKHQIILLTLLISFVTSIATGIVTVALMNQAPLGITQTINRVVERTIEQVTPSINQTTTKETIVVNVDDQITSAIDKNTNSIVRIYRTDTDPTNSGNGPILVSLGALVSDDGMIATDNSVISTDGNYFLITTDNKLHNLTIVRAKSGEQIALLKTAADDKIALIGLSKVAISTQADLKLGQAVVYLGGDTKNTVATGIISSLNIKDIKSDSTASSTATSTQATKTVSVVSSIQTSIPSTNFIEGGLLLNLSGELVGVKATYITSARTDLFTPVTSLKTILSDIATSQKKAN